jgi:hypothetical protein
LGHHILTKWESLQEGLKEVQEIIDICDFAVDLRQLYGPTYAPERPQHRMYEQYHSWELWHYFSLIFLPFGRNAMIGAGFVAMCAYGTFRKKQH